MDSDTEKISYSLFSCIGSGFSAIALGATLKRWYGIEDIQFFERHSQLGGTWFINRYPGAACDVPSALYSFSFEPNPNWTRVLPSSSELWEYLNGVAHKYGLVSRMAFDTLVQRCEWIEDRARWRLTVCHLKTGAIHLHESQFLFAATGVLVFPRKLDVPGADTFNGLIAHTGQWRSDTNLEGKRVVLFGNGCTGAQVVPAIVQKAKSVTHFVRTKHWIFPSIDSDIPSWLRLGLKWVPGATMLQRFIIFAAFENNIRGFWMTKDGSSFRARQRKVAETYMRTTAPAKYHDMLVPDFEPNCKRRIFDAGYLQSLHSDNFKLTDEKALEIVPEGVKTERGLIEADVIMCANGYITNQFAAGINVIGRAGETLESHWKSLGGPGAYNTSALSGFPNFFFLLGPNSVTGHTSTIMALENSVNYALRILKPVLEGKASVADVRREAEHEYVENMQAVLDNTVWNTGCHAWYVTDSYDGTRKWNSMGYPHSQSHLWYRSLFPTWSDWEYSGAITSTSFIRKQDFSAWAIFFLVFTVFLVIWGISGGESLSAITKNAPAAAERSGSFLPNYL